MQPATAADAATSGERASQALALSRACTALWVATLSLMTAFMQTSAPAHRYLIARKIAKNLTLLNEQHEVFTAECRTIFANLAQHWSGKADQLAPDGRGHRSRMSLLQRAFARMG
jgi:hypothetical protein